MRTLHPTIVLLPIALTAFGADLAWAQVDHAPLPAAATRLQLNRPVTVVTTAGEVVHGILLNLSASSLALRVESNLRTLDADDVRRVQQRQKDSLRNGVLIGAASGAAYALMWFVRDPNECGGTPCGEEFVASAGLGALIGLGIDALVRKTVTVENPGARQKPSVSPVARVRPGGASLAVAVRW